MSNIHIACIVRDIEAAEYLFNRLITMGYSVNYIQPLYLSDQIDKINQARACILIWSPDSINDGEMRELANKPLPLLPINLMSLASGDELRKPHHRPLVSFREMGQITTALANLSVKRSSVPNRWALAFFASIILCVASHSCSGIGQRGSNYDGWEHPFSR